MTHNIFCNSKTAKIYSNLTNISLNIYAAPSLRTGGNKNRFSILYIFQFAK